MSILSCPGTGISKIPNPRSQTLFAAAWFQQCILMAKNHTFFFALVYHFFIRIPLIIYVVKIRWKWLVFFICWVLWVYYILFLFNSPKKIHAKNIVRSDRPSFWSTCVLHGSLTSAVNQNPCCLVSLFFSATHGRISPDFPRIGVSVTCLSKSLGSFLLVLNRIFRGGWFFNKITSATGQISSRPFLAGNGNSPISGGER